ncbi:MAG TPA: ABC transporter ATP-binding protein [Candidatus Deferrimicrobium sp.]|nr:ABC transporter ATP-binding protein [Candidatus Deferrimicrobium sp.]
MENRDAILSAVDIHREFQTGDARLRVLKGITFDVRKSEVVAVTGASGVGKSTFLHILGGLDRPTSGDVQFNGHSLTGESEKDLARFRNDHVGFVFQHHYLLDDFTALENVMMPLLVAGRPRPEAVRKGELLLEQVGLRDRKNHRPRQLSGGEQQRVAVARALANEPELVLADEPSGNLDTGTGRLLHDLLFRLNVERDVTIVIATHNRELARGCHRQVEIVDGTIQSGAREAAK